ncbi:DNA repair protein XRCC3 isoform 2-T2 [Glossophaga mutica]
MDLDHLELNPRIVAAIRKAKLRSAEEVLRVSGPDLQRLTGLSGPDVQRVLRAVSARLRGSSVLTGAGPAQGHGARSDAVPSPALDLHLQRDRFPEQHQRLSLGCPVLDRLLGGGLPLEGITELAGRSSAGKTQLALQLCLAVQFPRQYGGLEAGAVYVCTEDAFPNKRLQQLIALQPRLRTDAPGDLAGKLPFGDRIFIEHVATVVTEAVEEDAAPGPLGAPGARLAPALGIAWANQLLLRLMADRRRPEEAGLGPPARTLRVVFAPHLPTSSCSYTVNPEGVRGTPGTQSG